jgi:hypothetical protein
LGFEVFDPILVGDVLARVAREEVDVVGHDYVTAEKPCGGGRRNFAKGVMKFVVREERKAVFDAERIEDDCGLAVNELDAVNGMAALGRRVGGHA